MLAIKLDTLTEYTPRKKITHKSIEIMLVFLLVCKNTASMRDDVSCFCLRNEFDHF